MPVLPGVFRPAEAAFAKIFYDRPFDIEPPVADYRHNIGIDQRRLLFLYNNNTIQAARQLFAGIGEGMRVKPA